MRWTLTALGTGNAFTLDNFQTSFLINTELVSNEVNLLIDCGSDTRFALKELGLTAREITDVYISHLHSDHVGGLEWLGFSRYFNPEIRTTGLYANAQICEDMWTKTLSGGMESIQGRVMKLDDYFSVHPKPENLDFGWWGLYMQPVQMVHIMNGFSLMPSYGLLVSDENNNRKVFITTDTQYNPAQLNDFYAMADVIIHDCESLYMPDGTPIKSGVHAHYEDLKTLPDKVKAKIWLTHYQDGAPARHDAVGDGFLGFLRRGQVLEFN